MAWNAGTFTRVSTSVSPAVGNTTIESSGMNTYTADVTAGINQCLNKDGSNAATGDLDLGSNKLTAVADGTLATDAPNVGQVQDGSFVYEGTVGGDADNITITLNPPLTAYAAGQVFRFLAGGTCTGGGVTLNVDGLGAVDVVTNSIADPRAGDISLNGIYTVVHNGGSRFLLQNPERETDGVFVNDSGGDPSVSSTALAVDGLTVDTWVEIGPTAASPTTTWTALDDVPGDVDWVEVAVYVSAAEAAVTNLAIYVFAKENGAASGPIIENTIAIARCDDGTSNNKNVQTLARGVKIPVDSQVQFMVRWAESGTSTKDIDLYLTGYGWN